MKKMAVVLISLVILAAQSDCFAKKAKIVVKPDLEFSAVAKFLAADGGWYLTEQNSQIFFGSISGKKTIKSTMNVTANEPAGQAKWIVCDGNVTIQQKPKSIVDKKVFNLMTDDSISSAVMGLCLAQTKPTSVGSYEGGKFVFEGKKYDFVAAFAKGINLYKTVKDNGATLAVTQGKKRYILHGYNYVKLEKSGFLPTKIDVFTEESPVLIGQYIIKFP